MPSRAPRRAATPSSRPRRGLLLVMALAACGAPAARTAAAPSRAPATSRPRSATLPPFTRVSVGAGMKVIVGYNAEQSVSLAAQGNVLAADQRPTVVDGQLIVTIAAARRRGHAADGADGPAPRARVRRALRGRSGTSSTTGSAQPGIAGGAQLTAIGERRTCASTPRPARTPSWTSSSRRSAGRALNDGSAAELASGVA